MQHYSCHNHLSVVNFLLKKEKEKEKVWFIKSYAMHKYIYITPNNSKIKIIYYTISINSLHLFHTHSIYNTLTFN